MTKGYFAVIIILATLLLTLISVLILLFETLITDFAKPQTSSSGITCTQSRTGYCCLYN